ncbi:coenzyme F420-reducing hydrogenase, partial [bacterium]
MEKKFDTLQKWRDDLNICIRCGYCFELCHLFRLFSWEADSPRGKLLLIYGLLSGDVESSLDIAEKIFQCFHCKNCEKSCSAKVPVTDIIKDAKTALIEIGYDVEGVASRVNEDLCSRCGLCVSVCKPEALSFGENGKPPIVDKAKCEGCGVCAATCP